MLWNVVFENYYFSNKMIGVIYRSTSLIKVMLCSDSNFPVLSMKWGMCVRESLGMVSVAYKAACSAWCFSFGWNINSLTCALWLPSLYIQFTWIYRTLMFFRILFSLGRTGIVPLTQKGRALMAAIHRHIISCCLFWNPYFTVHLSERKLLLSMKESPNSSPQTLF